MLSFDDQTRIYTEKNFLPTFVNTVLGGGGEGEGGIMLKLWPKKTIVVLNYFWWFVWWFLQVSQLIMTSIVWKWLF